MTEISTMLDHIDQGSLALPEFQRGYVWNRDQVRGFMRSLYRKHPVGSLLVWVTKSEMAKTRGEGTLSPPGTISLLLDGQQRLTTLYGIVRGKTPRFFDGNPNMFTGLYFNLDDETFEFYAPVKMKDNPLWVDVTALLQKDGFGPAMQKVLATPTFTDKSASYLAHLNAINNIKNIELHVDYVSGEDKTIDIVVEIFNRVNSGGTKLSKGDLALAKVCAEWPEARQEMKQRLSKWRKAGFPFRLELLLRCITAINTGQAMFSGLENVRAPQFQQGLKDAEKSIDQSLNLIASRLGLDHDRVFGSRYSLPLLARYISLNGGKLPVGKERDRLLYWYIHTFLWGRYAGSTESVLNQDLEAIRTLDGSVDRLITNLRSSRGDLQVKPEDFRGWNRGARFYPLLYMLTRVWHAKDFESELDLSHHMLGYNSSLEIHHIFPKKQLYKAGYKKSEVNAIANFTFLTKDTNLKILEKLPELYLPPYAKKDPKLIESHWIPMDSELWKIENYNLFLDERRKLLAKAANDFLINLSGGGIADVALPPNSFLEGKVMEGAEEERILREANDWVRSHDLPDGEYDIEVIDNDTRDCIATIDLGWPNGLQEGLSQPIALLINEDEETKEAVNQAGYRFFTDVEKFKRYIEREILNKQSLPI